MAIVESESPSAAARRGSFRVPRPRRPWRLAAVAAVILGALGRLALGNSGVGDLSALVMGTLLSTGLWLAAWLYTSSTRVAFAAVLVLNVALDVAALPARGVPEYDDRVALFRTDQHVSRAVPVAADLTGPTLTVVARAIYPADHAQPAFTLAGEVDQTSLEWRCDFDHGMRRLALPLPPTLVTTQPTIDVRLRLLGSPSRETDFLLVYASSRQGGYLVSLAPAASLGADVINCALAT